MTTTSPVFPDVGTRAPTSSHLPLPWVWLQAEHAAGRTTLAAVYTHLTSRARGPRWLRTRVLCLDPEATPAYLWKRALLIQQTEKTLPPKFRRIYEAYFGKATPVAGAMTFYGKRERRGGRKARSRHVRFSGLEHSDEALVAARTTRRLPSDRYALIRILEDARSKPLGADAMTDAELYRLAAGLLHRKGLADPRIGMKKKESRSARLLKARRATPFRVKSSRRK